MDIIVPVLLGIAFPVILGRVYEGEIISGMQCGARVTNRRTEPVKFWVDIVVQLGIWTVLVMYPLSYRGQ